MAIAPTKLACSRRALGSVGQRCQARPAAMIDRGRAPALTRRAVSPLSSWAPAASTDCVKFDGICEGGGRGRADGLFPATKVDRRRSGEGAAYRHGA